jgi:hypothetical protein
MTYDAGPWPGFQPTTRLPGRRNFRGEPGRVSRGWHFRERSVSEVGGGDRWDRLHRFLQGLRRQCVRARGSGRQGRGARRRADGKRHRRVGDLRAERLRFSQPPGPGPRDQERELVSGPVPRGQCLHVDNRPGRHRRQRGCGRLRGLLPGAERALGDAHERFGSLQPETTLGHAVQGLDRLHRPGPGDRHGRSSPHGSSTAASRPTAQWRSWWSRPSE